MNASEDPLQSRIKGTVVACGFVLSFAILHFICSHSFFLFRLFESVVSTKAMVMVAAAFLLLVLVWVCHGLGGIFVASRSTLFPPLAAWFAVSWISSLMGDHSHFGPYELVMDLAWGVWILAAFHLWRGPDGARWAGALALGALMVTLSSNVVHCIGFLAEGGRWDPSSLRMMLLNSGFAYPFYNCNFNAAFLMVPVTGILLSWRLRVSRDPAWGVAAVMALLAIPFGMIISKAATLVLGVGTLGLWLGPKFLGQLPRRTLIWGSSLAAVLVVAGSALFLRGLSRDEGFMLDSSAGARMEMWQGVVKMVGPDGARMTPPEMAPYPGPRWSGSWDRVRRFLLGYGPGAYPAVSATARPATYYAGSYTSDYSEHPHSSLMSFLFDGGGLGLAAGLWIFLRLFLLQYRLTRLTGGEGGWARVLLGSSLCLAAYTLVSVEGHYSEVRVWWALLMGGTMALETLHRRLGTERPREFAFAFTQVFLVVSLGVMFKFLGVVFPRLVALHELAMAKQNLPEPREIERIAGDVERTCLGSEGRVFACMHSVVGLKEAALLRENEAGRAQSLVARTDPTLMSRWRSTALLDLWAALAWAPDFSDLSRLYGEMLWKLSEDCRRSGKSSLRFAGRDMDVETLKSMSESWLHRAIIKGDQDALIFDTLRVFPDLEKRIGPRILDHPIFTEVFRRRAPSKAIRLPLRFNFAFYLLQKGQGDSTVDEALAVVPSILRDLPEEQAWALCQGLGEALLSRRVDPMLWSIVERGGLTPPHDRERILQNPLRSAWFLEMLRDRLFSGELPESWQGAVPPELEDEPKIIEFRAFLEKGPPPPH